MVTPVIITAALVGRFSSRCLGNTEIYEFAQISEQADYRCWSMHGCAHIWIFAQTPSIVSFDIYCRVILTNSLTVMLLRKCLHGNSTIGMADGWECVCSSTREVTAHGQALYKSYTDVKLRLQLKSITISRLFIVAVVVIIVNYVLRIHVAPVYKTRVATESTLNQGNSQRVSGWILWVLTFSVFMLGRTPYINYRQTIAFINLICNKSASSDGHLV